MAASLEQVRRILSADEPDYRAAARLGPAVLPHLRALVQGSDPDLASKATVLAGRIDSDASASVLKVAAASPHVHVRLAAAAGARRLARPAASAVVAALLDDRDAGVRKVAVRSAVTRANPALMAKVAALGRSDPAPIVRAAAARISGAARGAVAEIDFETGESECALRCGAEFERCTRFSTNPLECMARLSACLRSCGAPAPPPPRPSPPSPPGPIPIPIPPTVRLGSRGPVVQLAQAKLNNWIRKTGSGIPLLVIDGVFGPKTDAAVRRYQQAMGLTVDGVVGPQTWSRLVRE